LGNKPDSATKPDSREKGESKVSEKKTKDESKKKSVEAFELPGIQTETPPKVSKGRVLALTISFGWLTKHIYTYRISRDFNGYCMLIRLDNYVK
jgi:hypothetical protein